jgi:hypothetical protein
LGRRHLSRIRQRRHIPGPAWGRPSKKVGTTSDAWGGRRWGEVIALDNELPKKLNDPHARSKELTEEPCLCGPGTDVTFCSVLDVPWDGQEVGPLIDNVLDDMNHTLVGVVMVVVHHAGGGGNGGRGTGGGCGGWLVPFFRERGGRVVSCAHAWV